MAPGFWHDLSVGEIVEGTGVLWLVTDYLGYQCFAYAEGELWVKIRSDIQINKAPQGGQGDFNIRVYDNEGCDGPPASALGGTGNLSSTEIDRRTVDIPWSTDTDGDRCPDGNELNGNQQQGGLRDPFNRWDYMNPTLDGQNRVDDILATVNQYFIDEGNPEYNEETDRTGLVPGPGGWNLGPPNGQQRVDDILASVKSYFHDCSIPVP
jgi:hypothetical protein